MVRKRNVLLVEEDLAKTLVGGPVQFVRQLRQATKTGAWLTVQLSNVNGKELGEQEL